jgi:arylsulfatase A-like enzyme
MMRFRLTILLLLFSLLVGACESPQIPVQPTIAHPATLAVLPSPVQASPTALTPLPTVLSSAGTVTQAPEFTPTAVEALTFTPAPSPTKVNPPPKNVILIIADSLRSDHVSSYGYERKTTPNLDALVADQGVRFQHADSTASWTCPSVAAIMSGRTPSSLGTNFTTMRYSMPSTAVTLAEYLKAAGYYTAGFASTYCVKAKLGFNQGFNYYDDSLSDKVTSDKATAGEINEHAIDWLQNSWLPNFGGKPLFLMLYYFDPHVYYKPPAPYDTLYDPAYDGALTSDVYKNGEDVIAGKIVPTPRDVEHLKALYDGEITYWDAKLGEMLAFLQSQHLMDNTLLIVTSDHGEMFGEHDKWTHANYIYEEVLRVPLFMRYTGVIPPGTVSEAPAQNFDLMPTILDFAGIPLLKKIQAISLRAQAQGAPGDVHRPLYSEVEALNDPKHALYWVAPRISERSVEQDGWKLIHHLGHPDQDELYNLNSSSVYEIENLLQAQPDLVKQLLASLRSYFGVLQ